MVTSHFLYVNSAWNYTFLFELAIQFNISSISLATDPVSLSVVLFTLTFVFCPLGGVVWQISTSRTTRAMPVAEKARIVARMIMSTPVAHKFAFACILLTMSNMEATLDDNKHKSSHTRAPELL